MLLELLGTFAIVVALLAISGFFSGSETAITAVSKPSMQALERDGDARAGLVNRLISQPERLIGSILIGNNLVNILASALATSAFLHAFGAAGVAYATIAMTALVVVFAEVLPKSFAILAPERVALMAAPVLRIVMVVLSPVSFVVQGIVRLILGDSSQRAGERLVSAHEELREAIAQHHREGGFVKRDRDMLGGLLDLNDLEVADIMVHRTKMRSFNIEDPALKLIDDILKTPYSRVPVWRDNPDNIVGVVHVKDLLRELHRGEASPDDIDVRALAKTPFFVPDGTSLKDQLNAFLRRKSHFAIVVDEYGEMMGLVTLEDILEEIVGQIADEHDVQDNGIRPQADGRVHVAVQVADRHHAINM
ncbi:MAG: CNNM domain-containing protein, partial [Pseudomonadota bacterium]